MKVEEFIVYTTIENFLKKEDGNLYIEEKDIKAMHFTDYEKRCLDKILEEKNITIKKKTRPKKERRNYLYGENEFFEENKNRRNFHTNIEYSASGEIIMADFKELDSYLEDEFIPRYIKYKKNSLLFDESEKYIQLTYIAALNLSDVEMEHVMNYLQRKNISVNGCSTSLNGNFENYNQNYGYYKMNYPKPLTKEEQKRLFEEYRKTKDKEIRDKLVEHNMRFVSFLSSKYAKATGIDKKELDSYGFLGLIKAVEVYDSQEWEFLTIAKNYILKSFLNGIAEIQGFRTGKFNSGYVFARSEVERKKDKKLRENPELVDEVLDVLIEKKTMSNMHREENRTRIMLGNLVFFDDVEEECLVDDNTLYNQVLEKVENKQLRECFDTVFECLTEKERETIIIRFGFDDGEPKTLDVISKEFNISKQAVSSRIKSALKKIRNSNEISILKDFYDNDSMDYSYNPKELVKIKK